MHFKECVCGGKWRDRADFLADGQIILVGYQADFEDLKEGMFLFNHVTVTCGTTLSVAAGRFVDLYNGPIFRERFVNSAECEGHCLRKDDINPCHKKCECAFVREVLNVVSRWPKRIENRITPK